MGQVEKVVEILNRENALAPTYAHTHTHTHTE